MLLSRLLLASGLCLVMPAALKADDVVIFRDGFLIRGKVDKEGVPQNLDKVFNQQATLNFLSSGPRFVFFTPHVTKGAQVIRNQEPEKTLDFRRPIPLQLSPLPGSGAMTISGFNRDGRRTLDIKYERGPSERIQQVPTIVTPFMVRLDAIKYRWREIYDPKELGVATMRQILQSHPDIKEGWLPVPEPMKRMLIAQYFKEVGWYPEALAELKQLKKDAPWAWPKEANDRFDTLTAQIEAAETARLLLDVDTALKAGQYRASKDFLEAYQPKNASAANLTKLADLKAVTQDVLPKRDAAKQALRELVDANNGTDAQRLQHAMLGGLVVPFQKPPVVAEPLNTLLVAAEAVHQEVHPDHLERVQTFLETANDKTKTAMEKLSLAVSGWLRGRNGVTKDALDAAKMWKTREMLTNYLKSTVSNERATLLKDYLGSTQRLDVLEVAQIATLLPPIEPEEAGKPSGKLVPFEDCGATNTYKMKTGPLPEDADGLSYYLRLPREYHVGRSYPVILAMNSPELETEKMIGLLAAEADRYGYILAAPVWAKTRNKVFDVLGRDHELVTSCLRDLTRRFNVDPDKVFAFGLGHGANFTLDLSMSRPHLFAGVVCMSAEPEGRLYREYWMNAQKCPVYCVTGELSANSFANLRLLFDRWMPLGFYSVLSVYKGRSVGWFPAEVPIIFDWMNRKSRARGLAALRLDNKRFEPWQTFRETDNRFYWIGATELSKANRLTRESQALNPPTPGRFFADIRNNTVYVNNVQGIREITIWLEKSMIDWSQDVGAVVDTSLTQMKKRKLEPDLSVMLEELYRSGDRKMLFLGKLEFKTGG